MLRVEARTALAGLDLDVALDVAPGSCLALAGPSGAGKTSILRIVAGLRRPDRGTVRCGERTWLDTAAGVDLPPERRRCGVVFQEYALFPHLRAWQNVAYPLHDLPRGERRRRAHELLERFGVHARAGARPHELSGGERQRVALARALARRPEALLLDEPLSALDTSTRAAATRELAGALRIAEVPALLVTHSFLEASILGDAVGVVDRGRIVQRGSASALAGAPASSFVADFTGAIVLTGRAAPGPDGLTAVALDGGGTVLSTDRAAGRVAASVYPWEISLEPPGAAGEHSTLNALPATVASVTRLGNRVRVALTAAQPLSAEITDASARRLDLGPGSPVRATFKAAGTRLIPIDPRHPPLETSA